MRDHAAASSRQLFLNKLFTNITIPFFYTFVKRFESSFSVFHKSAAFSFIFVGMEVIFVKSSKKQLSVLAQNTFQFCQILRRIHVRHLPGMLCRRKHQLLWMRFEHRRTGLTWQEGSKRWIGAFGEKDRIALFARKAQRDKALLSSLPALDKGVHLLFER